MTISNPNNFKAAAASDAVHLELFGGIHITLEHSKAQTLQPLKVPPQILLGTVYNCNHRKSLSVVVLDNCRESHVCHVTRVRK